MDLKKLSDEEIQHKLNGINHWEYRDGKLHRELQFKDFTRAFGFMAQVAIEAQAADHHPEWFNVYNKVTIDLMTHDVDGISQLDFDLADKINELALV